VNHEARIKIRWSDMDAYGHVNNAVYLNYLEECRDRLVQDLFGQEAWDFVLAHVGIDYRHQVTQADGEIIARCAVASFGRSSVRTTEQLLLGDGRVVAEAESVIVPRLPDRPKSRPLTERERQVLQAEIDGASA
jgi:acyl-CoA thioester hydrolase